MKRRGRPVLGAISGFFTGLFLALTLLAFGGIALDSVFLTLLPIAGMVLVFVIAMWFPVGGSRGPADPAEETATKGTPDR